MDHTLALIESAHEGDKKARDTLVEENMGLVYSIVQRFKNRGTQMEDLRQIGCIGLIKAIDKFDTGFGVRFSTYAVPMIMGEIRRFLRDDGMLKVSRPMKELAQRVYGAKELLESQIGREPSIEEIAKNLDVETEEVVWAMEAAGEIDSLQRVIYQGEGNEIELMDKLAAEDQHGKMLDQICVSQMMEKLEEEERHILFERYYQEKTQVEIARELGVSQVQISRMEKRILRHLRELSRVE